MGATEASKTVKGMDKTIILKSSPNIVLLEVDREQTTFERDSDEVFGHMHTKK